jgi:hypothetical protein
VLGNRLRQSGRLDLAALTALLLLRAAWCHALYIAPDPAPARPDMAAAAIRMFVGYAEALLDQAAPVAEDARAMLNAVSPFTFAHASYPAACMRIAEILGLLGLLADGAAPEITSGLRLQPDRIARIVRDLLACQAGCAHPVSDGFAVSLIAPVLLTARSDLVVARDFITRAAVWVADRYDPEHGSIGLARPFADPDTEVAYLLGAPFDNGPARRPGSYVATVLTDLAAVLPESAELYEDLVNEFIAAGADPQLLQADELRAQWRPDGAGATFTPLISYAEPFPLNGIAAGHYAAPPPPVPAWDALALTSVTRDRHVVAVLRAASSPRL